MPLDKKDVCEFHFLEQEDVLQCMACNPKWQRYFRTDETAAPS